MSVTPGRPRRWIMPADYVVRADCVRAVLRAPARAASVTVGDFGAYLCSTPTTCKEWRTADGMHIDKARAADRAGVDPRPVLARVARSRD